MNTRSSCSAGRGPARSLATARRRLCQRPSQSWLKRALQFDVRTAFQSPSEAQLAFESVLASDRSYVTSSAKLEEWVSTVGGMIDAERRPPAPTHRLPSRSP